MHDSINRNATSLLSNSNRSLNIYPAKTARPIQQENSSKKLKINSTNGIKSTIENNSNHNVRSSLLFSFIKTTEMP